MLPDALLPAPPGPDYWGLLGPQKLHSSWGHLQWQSVREQAQPAFFRVQRLPRKPGECRPGLARGHIRIFWLIYPSCGPNDCKVYSFLPACLLLRVRLQFLSWVIQERGAGKKHLPRVKTGDAPGLNISATSRVQSHITNGDGGK